MSYKLAVANVVEFAVKFSVLDGGKRKEFQPTLYGDRLPQEDLQAELRDTDTVVNDFLVRHINGWRGQTLVLDDDTGQPATFSEAAFRAMLSVTGVSGLVLTAYIEATGAKGKTGN